ncbi:disease resistance protein SUMM2-like [Rosa rugosa]|uniref:disease resistance protein SUMM2-like n=1 Tax=Rosa rugosa TaxID=74645 RepID=UPI002B40BB5E|nr:disease resistance protein SUMM2-like [Rosa rugosa]
MHDVVRDVGLYIASDQREERFAVSHRVESNKDVVPEKYTSSALRTGKSSHRNELLLLSCMSKYSSELAATTMFEGMKELKVLDIKRTIISPILSSLPLFENLRVLYLEYCDLRSEMVGAVIGRLGTLMILSLRGSQISQLPDEFKNLSDLRLLDLTGCSVLRSISPGVISSLSRLEELLMWNSFENSAKSWLGELVSLGRLTNLEMFLPSVGNLGNSLLFEKLERFQISIGSMHEKAVVNPSDNYLRLHDVDAIYLLGTGIIELLKKTGTLDIKMRNLSCPLNLALDTECWENLTDLTLEDCYGLQYLIDMTLMAPRCVFPVLYSLKLKGLRWLEKIYHGEPTLGSLQRLRKLTLSDLSALKYVLKIESQSSILRNLEELYIQDCQSLEEIFAFEGSGHHEEEANEITFLNLTRLTLHNLPSFIGISKNIYKTNFPQLITMDLRTLPKFTRLCRNGLAPDCGYDAVQHLLDPKVDFPELRELRICFLKNFKEIWNNQLSPRSFSKLRCLIVSNCSKLVHLVPTFMQSRLQQLEMISVEDCPSIEEIFEFRRLSVAEEMQINKIIDSRQTHGVPHLLSLNIYGCNSLKNLLSPSIARSLGQLMSITMHECHKIEEIITKPARGDETEDKIMLPRLKYLKIWNLSSLIAFSQGNYNFAWPSMKKLSTGNCPKMIKFCSGSLNIPRDVYLDVKGNNIMQELDMCRK